jgi:type II secretory pathway predicted ATPase ExeA
MDPNPHQPQPNRSRPPVPTPASANAFFAGRGHLRVLKHLEQAIAQDDRLIVLTGDDGVGKTSVVQRLLRGLDHRNAVWCVLLSATQLDTGELPGSLARAFGAPGGAASPAQRHAGLRRHLSVLGQGRTSLAVVDDAHALPPEAIAELGEMLDDGPLRVLLVGRPGLRVLLQRQLALHPASLECHLEPLQASETAAYLAFRLQQVAPDDAPAFSDEAQALIHRFSRGLPQRIDRLCDRLLRAARQRGLRTVGAEEVQRIARPRLDDASIPMLTSAVEDELPSSGWAATSVPGTLPPSPTDRLPAWAVAPALRSGALTKRTGAWSRRSRRALLALSALVVGSLIGLWAWRYFELLRLDSTMTAAPSPAAPHPSPLPPTAATAEPPLALPSPARSPTPAPAAADAKAAPAPPRASAGTPIAPIAPGAAPCTAAVIALGLCTQNEKPP